MRHSHSRELLLVALAGLFIASPAWAQTPPDFLKGLTGVNVKVVFDEGHGTGGAARKALTGDLGLESGPIQAETELRLRQAGMKILPSTSRSSFSPTLVIAVGAAGTKAVLVHIALWELATLDRGSLRWTASTWEQEAVMQDNTAIQIREEIRDNVSAFLNQWLADNGK